MDEFFEGKSRLDTESVSLDASTTSKQQPAAVAAEYDDLAERQLHNNRDLIYGPDELEDDLAYARGTDEDE